LHFGQAYQVAQKIERGTMTDKVKQIIWVFDVETNRKKRIQLQTFLDRANHSFRHENIKYFALEKDRDIFAKECRE
jgi:hypothetical protein